ncbi:alpha/beta hydrolase [Aquihabitans sp. G128]|uniref:alpha/beta fold hydrolase n=1 Tax=Aquihabitans sp. G128 TaxID=2849779 RepID=UPI001C23EF39|nr:alpha/beta hydrolase [Aquihabitans sp. G128]QXC61765.1 alpha/beta hydrolase [Aquihabitans sp. G128]
MSEPAPQATYVLVHGGGSSARFWDRLLPLLDRPAIAVDLPGRGSRPGPIERVSVDDEAAAVVSDVEAEVDGPVVLVAHSSAGLLIPAAVAALGDRVVHVVLNAALVPPEGGYGLDCLKPAHAEGLRAVVEAAEAEGTAITMPGVPDDPEAFRTGYGGDPLSDDELAFVVDPERCVPDGLHHHFQPVRWSEAGDVPVTYVVNDRDRPVAPAMQAEMITRLPHPPTVVHLPGGHIPAVTDPAALAAVLAAVPVG